MRQPSSTLIRLIALPALFTLFFSSSLTHAELFHSSNKLPLIEVVGEGKAYAKPNEAKLSVSFLETNFKLEDARSKVDKQVSELLNVLNRFELDTSSLDSSNINIHPRYDYQKNNQRSFIGYQVNRNVSFTLVNLEQLDKLVKAISEKKIAYLDQIRFTHSNPEKLEQEALDIAIQNSKDLASHIAESYDAEIDKLYRVNYQSPSQHGSPRMMAMSAEMARDSGGSNYQQKDLEFRATVQASFTLK